MAVDTGEPEWSEGEQDPGPRKTFWEHVDDLRKVLVRCAMAIGIAFIVCIFLDRELVRILERPLREMDAFMKPKPTMAIQVGKSTFGPFEVAPESFPGVPTEGGQANFELTTIKVGDQTVLALKPMTPDQHLETDSRVRLHNLGPADGFLIAFQIALYAAVILSAPFWVYFIGSFVLPALHVHERRVLYSWLGWGTLLFLMGVMLTYFVLLPLALNASIKYSEMLGFSAAAWKAEDYIGFVTKFVLGMGIGFQFPVAILICVKLGFIDYRFLAKYRRHVIVLCFILGAVLTTPEVITQVAMAVPLYILYEISIIIAWYWDRKKRRAEAAA